MHADSHVSGWAWTKGRGWYVCPAFEQDGRRKTTTDDWDPIQMDVVNARKRTRFVSRLISC